MRHVAWILRPGQTWLYDHVANRNVLCGAAVAQLMLAIVDEPFLVLLTTT
jgi:hypothetical protein